MAWTKRSVALTLVAVAEEQRRAAGLRIVQLREARGWSQETLAAEAGVSVKSVSRLENGRLDARRSTVEKLANALEVPVGDITPAQVPPLGLGAEPLDQLDRIEGKVDALLMRMAAVEAAYDATAGDVSQLAGEFLEMSQEVRARELGAEPRDGRDVVRGGR